MALPSLGPPPFENDLVPSGKATPPWNRWLRQLWDSLRGFRATGLINTTWVGSPSSITSPTFNTTGGNLLVVAVSSGWRPSSTGAPGLSGFDLQVDGVTKATLEMYCNELDSHRVFPSACIVLTDIGAGSHTIVLARRTSTTQADDGDTARVTVVEFPF